MYLLNKINILTCVSEQARNLNFLIIFTIAIFNSKMANLIPTQFLGPTPNGMYLRGSIFPLTDGANL